jgi:nucleoside-diphosphate-sugar epimerase
LRYFDEPLHHREGGAEHLCERLGHGNSQIAVAGSTLIFHLAGILGTSGLLDRPFEALDVNVKGAAAALEVAKKCRCIDRFYLPNPTVEQYLLSHCSGNRKARRYLPRLFFFPLLLT